MFSSVWKALSLKKFKNKTGVVRQSKHDYFDSVNYVRTVAGLRNVLAGRNRVEANTGQEVTFRGLNFGATIKEAKKLLGKPELHVNKGKEEIVGHEVLFYFSSIGSVKVTQCLHFLHGEFIIGQSIVKTSNAEKRRTFCESIVEKYHVAPEGNLPIDFTKVFPVCDSSGNRIELLDAFDLTITYVTGDPRVLPTVAMVPSSAAGKRALLRNAFRERVVRYI